MVSDRASLPFSVSAKEHMSRLEHGDKTDKPKHADHSEPKEHVPHNHDNQVGLIHS